MHLGIFVVGVQNISFTFQHDSGNNKHNERKIDEYPLLSHQICENITSHSGCNWERHGLLDFLSCYAIVQNKY